MAKFYTMGCYTDKGLAGFVNNPSTNRKAATQAPNIVDNSILIHLRSFTFYKISSVPKYNKKYNNQVGYRLSVHPAYC